MSDKSPQERLKTAFNFAAKTFPELTAGATPVGMGNFGIVIAHDDGTLTKIAFKPDNEKMREYAENGFRNETIALQLFTDHPLQDIATPRLIEPPVKLDNEHYVGSYRMTRVPGSPLKWWPEKKEELSTEWVKQQHAIGGAALALFHKAAMDVPFEFLRNGERYQDSCIQQVEQLPDNINEAIAKANEYLQARKTGGVVHGDFHGENILADRGKATGVIDFSFAGLSENIYTDFRCVMPDYLPVFIKAYEQASGTKLDRHLVTATNLGMATSYLNYLHGLKQEDEPERNLPKEQMETFERMNRCLNDLIPVTGYKP